MKISSLGQKPGLLCCKIIVIFSFVSFWSLVFFAHFSGDGSSQAGPDATAWTSLKTDKNNE